MIVRKSEENDIDNLVILMKLYYDFYERSYPPDTKLLNLIKTLIMGKEGIQFIAFNESETIGFATLYFSYSTMSAGPITIMNDLFVIPQYRGKKIANELFNKCLYYTRKNGYLHMEWVTAKNNIPAQKFYDKMGGVKEDNWLLYFIK